MYVVRQPATVLYRKVSVDNRIWVLQLACLALPRDVCYIIVTNRLCWFLYVLSSPGTFMHHLLWRACDIRKLAIFIIHEKLDPQPLCWQMPPYLRWAPFSRYEIVRSIAIRATATDQTSVASSHMFPFFLATNSPPLYLSNDSPSECLHFHFLHIAFPWAVLDVSKTSLPHKPNRAVPPNSDLPTNFQFDSRLNQTLCTIYLLIRTYVTWFVSFREITVTKNTQ